MKKILGYIAVAVMSMLFAIPAFAASPDDISIKASEDVIAQSQTDISSDEVKSWTENSDANMDFNYVIPIYSTIGASKDSKTLFDTLEFTHHYNIPAVTSDGACIGIFTVVYNNEKWEIGSYTDGLDFVTAVKEISEDSFYFIKIPQLSGNFGFLTTTESGEIYNSISSKQSALSKSNAVSVLMQIKEVIAVNNAENDGSGVTDSSNAIPFLIITIIIVLSAAVAIKVYIVKHHHKTT